MGLLAEAGSRIAAAWRALRGWGGQSPESIAYAGRVGVWSLNQAMYDGRVYEDDSCRRQILATYCGVKDGRGRIIGHYNPARGIVDAQQNVLRGTWGKEIRPVLADDGSTDSKERPVKPDLADALKTIWRDSNLDTGKTRVIHLAALDGTVGLRVSRIAGTDRVVIQPDQAMRIFNLEEDAAGSTQSVTLKYKLTHNFGTPSEPDIQMVEVEEFISKDEFSRKVDGKQTIKSDDRANTFGFCPWLPLRHQDNGGPFGDWSFKGLEPQMHDINWRITQQGRSINRTQFPQWFLTAGGPKPAKMDNDGETVMWYVQSMAGTPPPACEAIVPQIDHAASMAFTDDLRQMLRQLAPVLVLNDMKLLSGLSGESIAQVLKSAEQAITRVRPAYHHAFIRALQMAVSLRIDMGLSTISGASTGDAAYKGGLLDFAFADMPALPPTVYQEIQQQTLTDMKTGVVPADRSTIQGNPSAPPAAKQGASNATPNGQGTNGNRLVARLKQTTTAN